MLRCWTGGGYLEPALPLGKYETTKVNMSVILPETGSKLPILDLGTNQRALSNDIIRFFIAPLTLSKISKDWYFTRGSM
jgi:hypothetical protein